MTIISVSICLNIFLENHLSNLLLVPGIKWPLYFLDLYFIWSEHRLSFLMFAQHFLRDILPFSLPKQWFLFSINLTFFQFNTYNEEYPFSFTICLFSVFVCQHHLVFDWQKIVFYLTLPFYLAFISLLDYHVSIYLSILVISNLSQNFQIYIFNYISIYSFSRIILSLSLSLSPPHLSLQPVSFFSLLIHYLKSVYCQPMVFPRSLCLSEWFLFFLVTQFPVHPPAQTSPFEDKRTNRRHKKRDTSQERRETTDDRVEAEEEKRHREIVCIVQVSRRENEMRVGCLAQREQVRLAWWDGRKDGGKIWRARALYLGVGAGGVSSWKQWLKTESIRRCDS